MFMRFALALIVLIAGYGVGMMIVIIWVDTQTGVKMLNGFSSMFAALVGLGSGYLLGRSTNGNGKSNGSLEGERGESR